MTDLSAVWEIARSALVSGIISIFILGYLKRYLDKHLERAEQEKKKREEYQHRRNTATANLRHAQGRLNFWLHHGLTKPPPNGELNEAFEAYQKAEDALKDLDREIVAEFEN